MEEAAATVPIVITSFGLLALVLSIWLSIVLWTLRNGISPMPTSEKVKREILAVIPSETQGTLVDLGSGWGTMAIRMAKLFPQCHVIGYETSFVPYYFSKFWAFCASTSNLQFMRRNFFHVSFSQVSLIYCYLYPGAMKQLAIKFHEELSPGTIVVSNTFALPGWEAVKVVEVKDLYKTRVYVYMKLSN